jgi:hypothetical protein
MIALFDSAKKENQGEFLVRNKERFEVLKLLWENFFAPESEKFSQEVYENCFGAALEGIAGLIAKPQSAELVIAFLQECRAPRRDVGADRWFLLRLLPVLVPLIHSESQAVRAGVEALIAAVAGDIAALVA